MTAIRRRRSGPSLERLERFVARRTDHTPNRSAIGGAPTTLRLRAGRHRRVAAAERLPHRTAHVADDHDGAHLPSVGQVGKMGQSSLSDGATHRARSCGWNTGGDLVYQRTSRQRRASVPSGCRLVPIPDPVVTTGPNWHTGPGRAGDDACETIPDVDEVTQTGEPVAHIVKSGPTNRPPPRCRGPHQRHAGRGVVRPRMGAARDPKQLPVCQACKEIYDMFKIFNDGLRDSPSD